MTEAGSRLEQSVPELREHLGQGGDSSLDDDVLRKELQNLLGGAHPLMAEVSA